MSGIRITVEGDSESAVRAAVRGIKPETASYGLTGHNDGERQRWTASWTLLRAEPSGQRTVTAADGARIEVEWTGPRGVWASQWVARWQGGETAKGYDRCPTDAEVLADYEAWRREKSKPEREIDRSITAPDGMAIKVSQGVVDLSRWFIHWPGGDMTEQRSRPSDAEVLVEYGKRKRDQERDAIKRELADLEKRATELRAKL